MDGLREMAILRGSVFPFLPPVHIRWVGQEGDGGSELLFSVLEYIIISLEKPWHFLLRDSVCLSNLYGFRLVNP